MDEYKLYFAYGSNINLDQMAYRCPAAQVAGPVVLKNYRLVFRGNNRGSGVATIIPQKGGKVYGLLWKITPECERTLDMFEGVPRVYEKGNVTVFDPYGHPFSVLTYVMTGGDIWRKPVLPSDAYYNIIRNGYRQNGLPVVSLSWARARCVDEIVSETTQSPQLSQLSGQFVLWTPQQSGQTGRKNKRGHDR